jgi:hypothetical protein
MRIEREKNIVREARMSPRDDQDVMADRVAAAIHTALTRADGEADLTDCQD